LYEAFLGIFQNKFEVGNAGVTNAVYQILIIIDDRFDSEQILLNPELQEHTTHFIVLKDALREDSNQAKFWKSFLDTIEVLLNLLYPKSSGEWNYMYVERVCSSRLWFIAYVRPLRASCDRNEFS
jgi:hypothetical protein